MTTQTKIIPGKKSMRTATAAGAAKARAANIRSLMSALSAEVAYLEAGAERTGSWGYAGDLSHIESTLMDLQQGSAGSR